MDFLAIKSLLDAKVHAFNQPDFISNDPICVPHGFSLKQDIEIAGLFAAVLAWGQRKTIINKCMDLLDRMDHSPYAFIKNHSDGDLRKLTGFVHRTFNDTDLLYFVTFLKEHYRNFDSLEDAFLIGWNNQVFRNEYNGYDELTLYAKQQRSDENQEVKISSPVCLQSEIVQQHDKAFTIDLALNHFRQYFTSHEDFPRRTGKHVSSPAQHSACKRLNMYLRWMVRKDEQGVDFGIWSRIRPDMLICPYDVHVDRVARALGLVRRKQKDWKTAQELTGHLREFDNRDPAKYDFALFGMGVEGLY